MLTAWQHEEVILEVLGEVCDLGPMIHEGDENALISTSC
jgi:hypothetical protein